MEDHQDDERVGEPDLWKKGERFGFVQPQVERAQGNHIPVNPMKKKTFTTRVVKQRH